MFQSSGYQRYTTREDRLRVMLPARMRSASGWSDACILNISSKGLLVYSSGTARPGTFVEIRRGRQLIVARVVWRKNQRIGLCSPDKVHVQDVIRDEVAATAVQPATAAIERRAIPRIDGNSRARARAMEFLATLLIAAFISGWAVIYVHEVLAKPLVAARAALSR